MTKEEYLEQLKVGDTLTRFFHGAGFVTQGEEMEVVHLTDSRIWLEEKMENQVDYKADSVYSYDRKTGKQYTDQFSFGMYHTIELPNSKAPD
jgi:hypothetical protein